eukprot:CAMPEP_0203969072 /NCGR_PEP_ID=MMETSP0359-20131031/97273_1 /ASSEMBLY_ACC=CAM_ASM_000338 /TAXON_ID=268821 /ORGANISM="Scrippsiella Hangoei, Strain SHTV-5" /LENGTH=197 /DNA_ID=CAMNT_0050907007 /DNA_START=21 /DNA_END=610 /DNA_ORIENTATION=-
MAGSGGSARGTADLAVVTADELRRHRYGEAGDTWVAIHGLVYDVTDYLPHHPGGGDLIEVVGGRDVTEEFEEADHSANSRLERRIRLKGVLEGCEDLVADLRARGWHEGRGVPNPARLLAAGAASEGGEAHSARNRGLGLFCVPVLLVGLASMLLATGHLLWRSWIARVSCRTCLSDGASGVESLCELGDRDGEIML